MRCWPCTQLENTSQDLTRFLHECFSYVCIFKPGHALSARRSAEMALRALLGDMCFLWQLWLEAPPAESRAAPVSDLACIFHSHLFL